MKKKYLPVVIIISFFLIIFSLIEEPTQDLTSEGIQNIRYVKIAGQSIKVDLALTKDAQNMGLSGREALDSDEGMLFVFKYSTSHPFWMKDMNFPIDIIWISEDFKIVYIKKSAQPESYPEVYEPKGKGQYSRYVLEVVAGFAEKNNLKVGDKIENFVSP